MLKNFSYRSAAAAARGGMESKERMFQRKFLVLFYTKYFFIIYLILENIYFFIGCKLCTRKFQRQLRARVSDFVS